MTTHFDDSDDGDWGRFLRLGTITAIEHNPPKRDEQDHIPGASFSGNSPNRDGGAVPSNRRVATATPGTNVLLSERRATSGAAGRARPFYPRGGE